MPTGKQDGEYMLDLNNAINEKTSFEITLIPGELYEMVYPGTQELLMNRTINLNSTEEVKIVGVSICKKDYVNVHIILSEAAKGVVGTTLQLKTNTGIIEGHDLNGEKSDAELDGRTTETIADAVNYRLDSEVIIDDINMINLDGQVYSPSKNANVAIKGISLSDGDWHKIESECFMWWFR